jgi:type IV secretion system protein VirD4
MMFHWWSRARDRGIYLGKFLDGNTARADVHYPNSIHAITIGPNGSGKGTGLIIPNLATLRRPVFIIDPKGEAAAITLRARAKLGPVKIINPFNVLAEKLPHLKSDGFNPLAALDATHDNFTDDCTGIGQALVRQEPGSDGAFFGGSAQDLLTCLVMHEKIMRGKDASLGNVRKMLTEPFAGSEHRGAIGLLKTILDMTESRCEPLRAKAGRFVNGTRSNMDIISTAINETRFLDSPPVARDLNGEGFDWDLMKREISTVYLVIPADRLESHANYLRLIVTSALRTLLRSPPSETLPPALFILDEFAQLGYLPPIENAMGIARGFGVQLWPFLQDLNQLKALYRDRWQSFVANAGCLTAFAPRDWFTAEYLSNLCGQKTVNVNSRSLNNQGNINWNESPHGFPLFRPEDLMKMPPGQMLCLVSGVDPFFTRAEGHWKTPYGRGLDPNPYFRRRRA